MNKNALLTSLQHQREETALLADRLFACPELGFFEYQTAEILCEMLKEEGIPFRSGLSGTGVAATVGRGDYHIALIADMDAVLVPRGGTPVPYHSCGHHLQMAAAMAILQAIRRTEGVDWEEGRVTLIATPAEEFIDLARRRALVEKGVVRYCSGKQDMIAGGLFDDVDCVLNLHVSGTPGICFDTESSLAGFVVKKVFFAGRSAHSGAAAHQGKNALHAAVLCLNACAFLQEQFPQEAGIQLHPILSDGGTSMNVIPESAVLETYIRASSDETLLEVCEKFDRAADHCAKALGIGCRIETTPGYLPLRQSAELSTVLRQNILELCPPEKTARGIVSGASGDVGDLSFLLPTAQMGFAGFQGRIHSDVFAVTDGQLCYADAPKALMGTLVDLLENPALRPQKADFAAKKAFYLEKWLLATADSPKNKKES